MGHMPIGLGAMMALAMSMDPHGMQMATREATARMPKETPADRERIAAAEAKRKRKAEKRARLALHNVKVQRRPTSEQITTCDDHGRSL